MVALCIYSISTGSPLQWREAQNLDQPALTRIVLNLNLFLMVCFFTHQLSYPRFSSDDGMLGFR